MRKLLAFMLMLTFAIVLVGCGSDPVQKSIEISGPKTVEVGASINLAAKILPDGVDQGVTWQSARPEVATVDANGKVTGVSAGATVIKATSKTNTAITGRYNIEVTSDGEDDVKPNLNGYTITIAQSQPALYETDPFHPDYVASDKEAKQQAWEWVEEKYNCQIVVEAYPAEYEWGPSRWNYILSQAASNVSDYDFLVVPDDRIGYLVEGNALIDISDWYAAYGQGYMDATYRSSGSYKGGLYSITNGSAGIYNVMYYNIKLFESLNLPKSPAQLFNDGEWTYSKFKEFSFAAQAALSSKGENYFAVSGNPTYYWVGLTNAGGVGIANPSTLTLNLKDPIAVQAATTLREIFEGKAMDPAFNVDQYVTSWNEGRALFSTGDLWFVNHTMRWQENMWGEGEDTKYGYVPFPRPDGTDKEDQKLGLGGTATYVMPIGRDYSAFGEECTAENIYRAMVDTFLKTDEFQKSAAGYDEDALLLAHAQRFTESDDSVEAFIYMAKRIKEIGFFDPMTLPTNPIENTGFSTFCTAIRNYVNTTIPTFAEAVDPHESRLQESLTKAFS